MSRRLFSLPSVGSGWYSLTLLAATVLMVLVVLAGAAGTADAGSPSEQRKFKTQFQGKFDTPALASGVHVPAGAGFGETVVVAHKCDFSFFTVGNSASAGVQALAEGGSTSDFQVEVTAAVTAGNAQASWTIEAPTSPTSNKNGPNSVPVKEDFSCLTVLVKINPTSDWFSGVSAHDLRAGGTWPTPGNNNNIFIDLFPFDAGTLDGTEFAASTMATSPQGTITSLRNTGKFSNSKIAQLKLTMKNPALTKDVTAVEAIESIIVTWGEVVAAGGYHVMWKSGAEAHDTDGSLGRRDVVVGGKTRTHTITGLTGGVEHEVQVIAYNEAGQSSRDPTSESKGHATPISAATAGNTVLVGNTTQRIPGTERLTIGSNAQYRARAQAFTTGSEPAVLGSVTLPDFRKESNNSVVDVHIYSASGVDPDAELYTLTRPDFSSFSSGVPTDITFNAASADTITLAINTTYFVVVESVQAEVGLAHTKDDDEDPATDEGWSIANTCRREHRDGTPNSDCKRTGSSTVALIMVLNSPLEAVKPVLSISGSEAVEGTGIQFTVSLSPALGEEVTVEYSTADDTATTADSDYTAVSGATLTFAANETEKTVTIATTADSTDEDDESFNVVLSSPSENAQLGYVTSASGLIINNDQTTQTDGTLSSITLTGSDGNTIALTPTFSQYKFLYTATANRELDSLTGVVVPSTTGTLQSIMYVGGSEDTVTTAYDAVWALVPGDNLIKFMVTSPDGSRTKIYKIHVNKDPSTDATLSDLTLVDNNGTAITLSPAFNSATTEYTASAGAAVSSVTLTGTQNYSGATMSNNLGPDVTSGEATVGPWAGESVINIDLTAEDGATTKHYTVTAERTLTVNFDAAAYSVDEGDLVQVSVSLDGVPGDSVRADLSTARQGGATTADYRVPTNVVFASGETSKMIPFSATQDSDNDPDESVKIGFDTLPTGYEAGATSETTVSMTNPQEAIAQGTIAQDTIAPTLEVATVDGTSMALIYSEALDTGSVPAPSAYSVVVDSATGVAPSSVAVTGAKVKLTLSSAATSSETVTVTYTKPGTNPLQDLAGNDAAALSTRAVTNNTGSTNNQPAFSDDADTRSVAENTASSTQFGDAVTATDSDTSDTLTYSLPGGFSTFTIDTNTGQLETLAMLNHEETSSYLVPVYVRDNKDAAGNAGDTDIDDTIAVTITVTNVDEPGTVAITGTLSGGSALTASVTNDPDGAVSSVTWQWARGSTQGGSFSNISGATNASYTTTANDVGEFLQATASYTDPEDSGKTASAVTSSAIGASNSAPTFSSSAATRTVPENSSAGTNVGGVVDASDSDTGDTLTYSLSGTDANDFSIVSTSGQIQTRSGVTYNFEAAKNSYSVTVTVHDGKDAAGGTDTSTIDDTIAVTINLTNVNEPGTVAITGTLSGGEQLTASVTDIDGAVSSETWRWARGSTQGGSFSNISGATNASYTSVAADVGKYLQATASYTDPEGPNKSASAVTTSAIEASNDEPEFSAGTPIRTLPENSGAGVNAGSAVAATDGDSDTLTYALKSGNDSGDFTIVSTSGQIQAKSGETYNYEGSKNSYTVIVTVHDGKDAAGGNSTAVDAEITVTINLTNVNEIPMLTSPPSTKSVPENSTAVHAYAATDEDAGTVFSWSLSGADAPKFQISSSGVLTFRNAPDFENPTDTGDTDDDNIYVVTVRATDDGTTMLFDGHTLRLTVTDVNETPEITSGPATISKDENTPTTEIIATYVATDPDATTGTLSWDLQGNDMGDFVITKNTTTGNGELKFRNVPNYEVPADTGPDNVYDVTVRVRDNGSTRLQDTQMVAVTVNDVNETPVVSGNGSPSFPEIQFDVGGSTLTTANLTVPGDYTFTDEEGDDVTWSLSGTDANHFTITEKADGSAYLEFKNPSPGTTVKPANYEIPLDDGSGNTYVIIVQATDNNAQGGKTGTKTGTFAVTVTVTDVDETPEITTTDPSHTAPSFPEIEYDARDEEAENITWSLTGNDAGDFTIDSNGVLTFRNRPDYEMPTDRGADPPNPDNVYEIVVKATDATPNANTRELGGTVTVTDVNERPDIDEDTVPSYVEVEYDFTGTRPDVHTFTATDYDDMDTFSWSLEGVDKDHLEIDSMNGVLTFKQDASRGPLPNFEHPRDDNADGSANTYNITVRATDNHAKSTDYLVTINVTDVNETPEFTGTPETTITRDEHDANDTYVSMDVADYDARDEEAGVTWSLTDTDSGDFNIDSNGVLTFAATPNFESPADFTRDNVYEFTVVATDVESGSTRRNVTQAVTVTVEDVEEAGAITVSNSDPGVGDVIRFDLTDPDGEIVLTPPTPGNPPPINWDIQTRTPGGAWLGINAGNPLATSAQYQALEVHTGREVRAVVTYIDPRGPGKSAESEATAAITADPIINAPPRFVGGGSQSIPEGEAGRFLDERLTATDRDEGDILTFGLGDGVNSHLFEVNASTGRIRAVEALDFETAPSSGYLTVPITLHDGRDADGNVESPPVIDDTGTLSIYITDVEEDGVVTLSQEDPEVGVELRASLTDGDGRVSVTSWQWARSENGRTGWTNISGATSNSYTPEDDDGDFYLRARVSYTDRRPGGKSADAVTGSPVPSENRRPSFPSTETGQRTIAENTRANESIGLPVAADDPEDDLLTYSLSGPDAAAFTIVTSNGQIQTSELLDFETKRSYSVTVEVHDGRDGSGNTSTTIDDNQAVTITIEDVEEPGTVTLTTDTQTIQARVPVTATLEDGDGPFDIRWQWARSPNGRTGWANIANATSTTYTPTLEDDTGNYIRATASYTDGHGENETAGKVSPRVGDAPPVNSPPAFPSTEDGRREVAENSGSGTSIGDPVAATDLNAGDSTVNDPLAYSLTGTDADSFTIDAGTGQIRLASGVTLDYEGKRTHRFTVQVTDGSDENGDDDVNAVDARQNVTITVTNVNEAPEVTGDDSPSFQEDASSAVATYRATDPERDTLTWSVSGNDFWISSRGQLYFRSPPSFEEQTTYLVTVTTTDDDETAPLLGSLVVTVTVTDVEEDGTIIINLPRGWNGTMFQAVLDDDDGGITGETRWQWERSSNQSSWEDISGATLSTYTASADDVGQYLRATVSYEDGRGSGKETSAAVKGRIEDSTDRPTSNNAPAFTESAPEHSVGQGTAAGRNVGSPVRATDEDTGDVLTYSLGGTDALLFDIDPATGQILTKAVLDYDPDGTNSYSVEVRVLDGFGPDHLSPDGGVDDTITVTIFVTQARGTSSGGGSSSGGSGGGGGGGGSANRPPEITGPKNLQYAENSTEPVATYEAEDPEGTAIRWEIEDTDEEHFRISEDGVLSFKKPPDYENPVDFRLNNTYEIRLLAFDSGRPSRSDRLQVRIEIKDVDLPGVPQDYDANDDEMIALEEAIAALAAFSEGAITREEATAIVKLYFSNPTHGNEDATP